MCRMSIYSFRVFVASSKLIFVGILPTRPASCSTQLISRTISCLRPLHVTQAQSDLRVKPFSSGFTVKEPISSLKLLYQRAYSVIKGQVKKDVSKRVRIKDLVSQSHINSLSDILGCHVSEVKALIRDHPFFMHMSLDLVKSKVKLIESYQIPLIFVRQNARLIYQTSNSELDRRLHVIKDVGLLHSPFLDIQKLAHLLECRNIEFKRCLKYKCDQRDALEGCTNQLEYLQMRLGCSEKTAKAMLCSYPLERNISNTKVKAMLDFFLIEVDKSPDFVISQRKLLVFSLKRLKERWAVMQREGIESESSMVYVWSMPQKAFKEQYQLSEAEKKKENSVLPA